MALDVKTGDAIWQLAEPAGATRYTSIMPLAGGAESENRYVQIRGDKVALFNDDGKLKDTHDWRWGNSWQATSAFPLEHGAFYLIGNSGSERCEVINDEIVPVYNEPRVSTYHQGAVLVEEQVFISKSRFLRQDLATGDLLDVSRQEQMNGPILAGDGLVLVLDAAKRDRSAQVTLFRASDSSDRKSFSIEGRSKYFDGSRYNGMVTHPVVANGHLYIRDQELLLCFRFLTNETP